MQQKPLSHSGLIDNARSSYNMRRMRATTGAISRIFENDLGIPRPTSRDFVRRLRKDVAVIRPGKQGPHAPALSVSEVTNWTIALCAATATTRKSPDALETVRAVRAAPRIDHPDLARECLPEAIEGLSIDQAKTAGEAIDSLITDMRSGAFEQWKGGPDVPFMLRIRFVNGGRDILFNLTRFSTTGRSQSAFIGFRSTQSFERGHYLTYTHELDGSALEHLAQAMGQPIAA
jgi:hypothetical protein